MSDVNTHRKLASTPHRAAHDIASAQTHDPDYLAEEALANADACCKESPAGRASDLQDQPLPAAPTRRHGIKQRARVLLKPLIAVATTQYVIVTAFAALAAVAVASEAGKIINAQLAPIIAALKRL